MKIKLEIVTDDGKTQITEVDVPGVSSGDQQMMKALVQVAITLNANLATIARALVWANQDKIENRFGN